MSKKFGLQALIIPTNHPFPECTAHPLGICIAESGASLLLEYLLSDFHLCGRPESLLIVASSTFHQQHRANSEGSPSCPKLM